MSNQSFREPGEASTVAAPRHPLDRVTEFHNLYALMFARQNLAAQIGAQICKMKDRGIEDAALIKAVIDEMLQAPEVRANRDENERKKDAIFEEFFGAVQQ